MTNYTPEIQNKIGSLIYSEKQALHRAIKNRKVYSNSNYQSGQDIVIKYIRNIRVLEEMARRCDVKDLFSA